MAFRARLVGGRPSLGPSGGGEVPRARTVPAVLDRTGFGRCADGEVGDCPSSFMVTPGGVVVVGGREYDQTHKNGEYQIPRGWQGSFQVKCFR